MLLEAQRNIQAKLGDSAKQRFYSLLAFIPYYLASLPDKSEFNRLGKLVNRKDVHVIAAALEVHASFLLTLDKGLVLEVNKANLRIRALTPGDFIKTTLPHHVDYPHDKD